MIAYFQLGMTYQKMKPQESKINFDQTIQLFTEMEAPKQIAKVVRQANCQLPL